MAANHDIVADKQTSQDHFPSWMCEDAMRYYKGKRRTNMHEPSQSFLISSSTFLLLFQPSSNNQRLLDSLKLLKKTCKFGMEEFQASCTELEEE